MNPKPILRHLDRLLALAFALCLIFPTAYGVWKPDSAILPNAAQTPLPTKLRSRKFPRQFEAFFESHLGLRLPMVKGHSAIDFFLFQVSPSPVVLAGRNGWAFLNQNYMPESLRGDPFAQGELDQWVAAIQQTQRFVAPWGAKVLIAVAPNKARIYPEYLPSDVRAKLGPPRLDAFYERLRREKIEILDFRPALLAAKERTPVYAKRDTHWMGIGLVIAAGQLAEAVGKLSDKPVSFSPEHFVVGQRVHAGDLSTMLALESWGEETVDEYRLMTEAAQQLPLAPEVVSAGQSIDFDLARTFLSRQSNAARVLIQHDSFGVPLQKVLPQAFSGSTWILNGLAFNHTVMAREHPDVVVLLMAERFLHRGPPGAPFGPATP